MVGMSAGGATAQFVALDHPALVASVTAISTTTVGGTDRELPGPRAEYMKHAATAVDLDWSDTAAVGEFVVRDARALAGTARPFDEAAARDLVARDLERAARPESLVNHTLMNEGEGRERDVGEISAPFLVVHGTADPLFPHEHGVALAEAIPEARLVTIEGGAHGLHEADWGQIVEAIVTHTATR
jgi:pimeloyl-ACP methyl ester carboxylesterase